MLTIPANLRVYGKHEQKVIDQLARCVNVEDGALGVLCPDGHYGYSQPVGGAVAYRGLISPSGVGYDIGCGNKAVLTDLTLADVDGLVPAIMDEVFTRISFGMGRKNNEPVDHPVLDKIRAAEFAPQRQLADLAAAQLGTVGAGNHYVDLFADEQDRVWIGVHFGSRGFGHKTASGFLSLAAGGKFDERGHEGEMDSPPVVLSIDADLGQSYIEAMSLAGAYAYAGRDVVVDKVLDILGASAVREVHNHHNFAWREQHHGEWWWVIRKGCTPAFPGQQGFVGATMGETSVILEGTDSAAPALFSTVHGAGRAMSRTEAAGKFKRRKLYECAHPGCRRTFKIDGISAHNPAPKDGVCPDHPRSGVRKVWVREQVRAGRIDFEQVQADLTTKQIELRGGAADEAPGAYKRLTDVLASAGHTVRVLHHLRPIGVAMAASDTVDEYKD